jgi:hypothetical protein
MVGLYWLSRFPRCTGRIRAVRDRLGSCLLAGLLGLAVSGCRKPDPAALETPAEPPPEAGTFVLADLLPPFTPPPLAELEAQVEWKPQPVLDAIELLRNRQAGKTPAISVAAALEMRNDSPETNAAILAALGRLRESAEVVDWDSSVALIGITVGALAGYLGGKLDMVLSRVIEMVMCIPPLGHCT